MVAASVLGNWPRQQVKRSVEFVAARLPRKSYAVSRLILGYHGVRDTGSPEIGERTLHIAADSFERQLRLAKAEAEVVPLAELLREPVGRWRLLSITFDDAYASALRNGVAACVALDLPCTVFVAPALLGTIPPWDLLAMQGGWTPDERKAWLARPHSSSLSIESLGEDLRLAGVRIATEAELAQTLARSAGMMLGNHTFTHINLGAVAPDVQQLEVYRAHEWLMAFAGDRYAPHVAYPFGIAPATDSPEKILPAHGFGFMAQGGSFGVGFPQGRSLIPRWNVPADVTPDGFRSRLRGWLLPHSS
jgi:peptidoglycan/xylan/chitin deacetylase (PgdA/CDA1 family)